MEEGTFAMINWVISSRRSDGRIGSAFKDSSMPRKIVLLPESVQMKSTNDCESMRCKCGCILLINGFHPPD